MFVVRKFSFLIVLFMVLTSVHVRASGANEPEVRYGAESSTGTVTVEAWTGSSSGYGYVPGSAPGPAQTKPFTDKEIRDSSHLWSDPGEVGLSGNTRYVSYHPGPRKTESEPDVEEAVARAIARLQIPSPQIVFGPEPSVNEWNAIPVNFPIWLNLVSKSSVSQRVQEGPLTIDLTARLANTYWQMGDGTGFSCSSMSPRPAGAQNPPRPSPTCGHTYRTPGSYQVSAISTWQVSWSVNGQSGTMTVARGGARQLNINELRSLVTR